MQDSNTFCRSQHMQDSESSSSPDDLEVALALAVLEAIHAQTLLNSEPSNLKFRQPATFNL